MFQYQYMECIKWPQVIIICVSILIMNWGYLMSKHNKDILYSCELP